MSTAVLPRSRLLSPTLTGLMVRRFTLDEYHKLIEIGFLNPSDPYELLNGVIKYKMPQNNPHASTSGKLEMRLWRMIGADWFLRTQKPVSIPASDSEPEPDLAVVLGPDTRYDDGHPTPREVAILIEVADTSLAEDQGDKLRTYAAARIREYWIVNIPDRRVEVYTDPRGGRNPTYRTRTDHGPGQDVPVVLAGEEVGRIAVADVLSEAA